MHDKLVIYKNACMPEEFFPKKIHRNGINQLHLKNNFSFFELLFYLKKYFKREKILIYNFTIKELINKKS